MQYYDHSVLSPLTNGSSLSGRKVGMSGVSGVYKRTIS